MSRKAGPGRPPTDPEIRFWRQVDTFGDCWTWTSTLTAQGYGRMRVGPRKVLAHRFSWELVNGPIPEGMQIDHRCLNRACSRPSHLRLTTQHENMQNLAGAQTRNRTGVRGVAWKADKRQFRVAVTKNRKTHFGGYFKDLDEAAEAARQLRLRLFTHNEVDRRTA